jgi:CPA2 family monovalent cation:H+ antiporter-2
MVDARLPGPLQTFVALYGSWFARLRAAPKSGRSRVKRLWRVLAIDVVLLAVLFIGTAVWYPRLVALLDQKAGLSIGLSRAVVLTVGAVFAVPLLVALVRTTHLLGLALAVRALPTPEARKVDMARAPRRALEVTIQFGVLCAVVVLLVVITQPFAPRIPGIAVVLVAGLILLLAVWRSAKNLQGHAIAAGEVIAAALGRQMGEGAQASNVDDAMQRMQAMLPGLGEPVAMTVASGSQAAGRSLRELDMRGVTGATVLALLRGDQHVISPRGDTRLAEGDVIAVAGTHDAVTGARAMVAPPREPVPVLKNL